MNMDIFRAYDIRGVYPSEINEEIAYKIGRALVVLLSPKTVAIGRDIRLSSSALSESLIRGITDQGADIIDIGLAASPALYFSVINYGFDAGVIVTASHNSSEFNGFKIVGKNGIPFGEVELNKLRKITLQNDFPDVAQKGTISRKEILKDYLDDILEFIPAGEIPSLKIVADAGNGIAGLILPELFRRTKCQIIPLFWELDGSFPNHLPNLAANNLIDLKKAILEHRADLGVAFDGDADRVVFFDERGEIIPSDFIAALMIKNYFSGEKIVADLRISWIVRDIIQEGGGQLIQSRVGHSFIKQKMSQEKAVFGAELSGHYYLGGRRNFESGFAVVLAILKLMKNQKVSELIEPLKKYFNSGELNFEVKNREEVLKRIEKKYPQGDYLDGLSFESDDWRFNLRLSNTEPIVRLVVEAKSKDLMETKKKELVKLIEEN